MALKFNPLIFSGLDITGGGSSSPTIGNPVNGADINSVLIVDSSGNLQDVPLTDGQLVIGITGSKPIAGTLTGTANQITVTTGSGTITLALPQDIATTSSPHFANVGLSPSGSLDVTSTGTLAIGTANANIINIGNSGATVNIQGTTLYENVTQLQVKDPLITLNKGGGTGSASNSGIELEENSTITAYVETSSDRNSWTLKAPNTAGIATITPGASGITLDQSSHNPVTIGTANGLSLSTQVLSLGLSSTSTTGALSSTDWNTFNAKQPAGNYITALTGDGTASGPGSVAFTLATVNSNVGTFASSTVNAKGLVTAAANLSGDATTSGSALTLATVNTNTGSFGSASSTNTFTVNGKGLITAVTNTQIQITESQVTNLTTDLAGKANVTLNNLGTTAVNADINPVSLTLHLGSSTSYWNAVYSQNIFGPSGSSSISVANGQLNDSASNPQLTFNTNGITLSQLTANTALYLDVSNIVKSSTTTSIELGYVSGVTSSIQTQLNSKVTAVVGDILPASYSLVNNTSQSITGLIFANTVSSFECFMNVQTVGSSNTFTTVKLTGTRKAATWATNDLNVQYSGDAIPTFNNFTIQSSGQVSISVGNISGFTSGTIKFRAIVLS